MQADWIRHRLPSAARRVADIGCGVGSLFAVIGPNRSTGIDVSATGLRLTRQRFPRVPALYADTSRLPLADQCLDAITVQHVVEHLRTYERACEERRRVLKPGVVLLVLTPNAAFDDPSVYADKTHVHIFDAEDLCAVLEWARFVVEDVRTVGLPLFVRYRRFPGGWRLRRFVTQWAEWLSMHPPWRWKGQTLCCAARRPAD